MRSSELEYELPQVSDIGLHPAFVTFTELGGDMTTAVVDFSVERKEENSGQMYGAGIYSGACATRGELERDLGNLPAGVNTADVKATFHDGVLELVVPLPPAVVAAAPRRVEIAEGEPQRTRTAA